MKLIQYFLLVLTISLHLSFSQSVAYDPQLSKDLLFYSKTSYCTPVQIQSWNCPSCLNDNIEDVRVFNSDKFESQGYVAYDSAKNHIIVAFRGTENVRNWMSNLHFTKTKLDWCKDCTVHVGFWNVWNSLSAGIIARVQELKLTKTGSKVFVTGHSLGGAVANLCALQLQQLNIDVYALYTFGSPRVGGKNFSDYHASMLKNAHRVVNKKDPVPHVPPHMNGFLHTPRETWYKSNMVDYLNFNLDNSTAEDKNGSYSITLTVSVSDHLGYLGYSTDCNNELVSMDKNALIPDLEDPIVDEQIEDYGFSDEDLQEMDLIYMESQEYEQEVEQEIIQ